MRHNLLIYKHFRDNLAPDYKSGALPTELSRPRAVPAVQGAARRYQTAPFAVGPDGTRRDTL